MNEQLDLSPVWSSAPHDTDVLPILNWLPHFGEQTTDDFRPTLSRPCGAGHSTAADESADAAVNWTTSSGQVSVGDVTSMTLRLNEHVAVCLSVLLPGFAALDVTVT